MQWTYKNYIDGMPFVPVTFPLNKPDGILIENLQIEKTVEYINLKQIKKAFIQGMENFTFLLKCPKLEHIRIEFQLPFSSYSTLVKKGGKWYKKYDLSSLYSLQNLKSIQINDNENSDIKSQVDLDIEQFKCLEEYYGSYQYVKNIEKAVFLKTLSIHQFDQKNLALLSHLNQLDTLSLSSSKISTLFGIEGLIKLKCLYLYYNYELENIDALFSVRNTLKALRIENCSKIKDFSVLKQLHTLELLELSGNNTLPNLEFIAEMKQLKTFIFNVNILDGNLSHCLDLSYVYSERNRRHYNLKDIELPKGVYVRGNESIEEWRRLE